MARLILDSGAVIALAARNRVVRAFIEEAAQRKIAIVIPAVVLAETTRGGPRDAAVNWSLRFIDTVTPVTEAIARQTGVLLARANIGNATIDALIVAEAVLNGPAVIMTGDPDDLSALAEGHSGVQIAVF